MHSKNKRPKKREKKKIDQLPHRQNAKDGSFSFKRHNTWKYEDAYPTAAVRNPLDPYHEKHLPHLVLYDGKKRPRFVLRYGDRGDYIEINNIQRMRTQYTQHPKGGFEWSPELERDASKRFAEELGMHPAEFLVSEFISRNREHILDGIRGKKTFVMDLLGHSVKENPKIYRPIVSRFFRKVPFTETLDRYVVDPRKERVRRLLGLRRNEALALAEAYEGEVETRNRMITKK